METEIPTEETLMLEESERRVITTVSREPVDSATRALREMLSRDAAVVPIVWFVVCLLQLTLETPTEEIVKVEIVTEETLAAPEESARLVLTTVRVEPVACEMPAVLVLL
jgi:hypothetical protein